MFAAATNVYLSFADAEVREPKTKPSLVVIRAFVFTDVLLLGLNLVFIYCLPLSCKYSISI